jgi:hypothetical protein
MAQALAMELRSKHGLPAYVLRTKDFPGRSNIRNVLPTAYPNQIRPELGMPEKLRTDDEAGVLVGNEKTLDDSERLLHKVKKIRPICLEGVPDMYRWRLGMGLYRAIRTTNPYIPAELLFQRKPDTLISQMNSPDGSPHSIFKCPGQYSLQVAEFSGRATLTDGRLIDARLSGMFSLRHSPLATAHDDAERLAEALAKDPKVKSLGYVPYVYHDRYSSKVFVGAFNSPTDPEAVRLRQGLIELAVDLNNRKVADVLIVPATALTDLTAVKR